MASGPRCTVRSTVSGNLRVRIASNIQAGPRKAPAAAPADNDRELVHRARAGDTEAFATLVNRYQDPVYNLCRRICRHPEDALDLAQTVFLRAWRSLSGFEAKSTFFTWLYRIAINAALSLRRAERTRIGQSLNDGLPEHAAGRPSAKEHSVPPSRSLEVHEEHAAVAAALAAIDDEFRAAVVLKDVEGLDYADIAAILGVPVGTVKSRIFRGRQALRRLLTGQEG